MKKQVKEWIVDKNLTTDSFDSIMIGVIYNSGHSTLDDPDVRKWIETHPSEFRGMLLPNLTDDQQVVLEWLTENIHLGTLPFNQISLLNQSFFNSPIDTSDKYLKAFGDLDSQEQFQVLAAFAEWGCKSNE